MERNVTGPAIALGIIVLVVVVAFGGLIGAITAPTIVEKCTEDGVITIDGECSHPDIATFEDGYWRNP